MSFMRKPHRKAKTGCTSCKRRRIKCDEGKPVCVRCEKRNLQCIYLPVVPRNHGNSQSGRSPESLSAKEDSKSSLEHESNHESNHSQMQPLPPVFTYAPKQPFISAPLNDENYSQSSVPMHHFPSVESSNKGYTPYQQYPVFTQSSHSFNQSNEHLILTSNSVDQAMHYPFPQSNIQYLIDMNNSDRNRASRAVSSNHSSFDKDHWDRQPRLNRKLDEGSSSEKSFVESINSLEPSKYTKSSFSSRFNSRDNLNNKYETFCREVCNNFTYKNQYGTESENPSNNNFSLPQSTFGRSSSKRSESNSEFFQKMKILNSTNNQLNHSVRLPHSNDENLNTIFNSVFITPKLDLSYLSSLHINNQFLSYACHFELNMKIQKYCTNNLPFILSSDKFCIQLILVSLENSPLYESLFHVLTSLTFICLYHSNMSGNEKDQYFGFDSEVYLTLSDYHMSRSIQSLNLDVNLEETCRRTCCLYLTSIFQIYCSILQPSQKICSRTFLMLYKNMEFIGDTFNSYFGGCSIFIESLERAQIKQFSTSSSIFFPLYLFDLSTTSYEMNTTDSEKYNKLPVEPLSNENKRIIDIMVERLAIVYKSFRNKTNFDFQVDSNNEIFEQPFVLEDDLLFTIHRLFYRVPDEFIHLVSIGDPRSLIIVGYSILLLTSKPNKALNKRHLRNELDYILDRLDKFQNSKYWKAWLNPVIVALTD